MRPIIPAIVVLALGLSGGLAAAAQAQSLPNAVNQSPAPDNSDGAIAVPPAPQIVPEAPDIQQTPVPAAPQPPGLIVPAPPADVDNSGNSDNGDNSVNSDGDNGQPGQPGQPTDNSTGQSVAPAPQVLAPDIAPIPPNTWVPAQSAKIGVLDKIDGSVSVMTIPVGGQTVVGDLQVNVQACMTRPPDQVPDAAVFLALQNTQDSSAPPNYRGWLVRSAPGAAVAGDAGETFRIIACN